MLNNGFSLKNRQKTRRGPFYSTSMRLMLINAPYLNIYINNKNSYKLKDLDIRQFKFGSLISTYVFNNLITKRKNNYQFASFS